MKNRRQKSQERSEGRENKLIFAGGLITMIVLIALGTWAMLDLANDSTVPDVSRTSEPRLLISEEEIVESPTLTPGFFDDFEDGLDPVWVIHYGDPFVENGKLTSNVGAGIAAGDISWRNYQVEFEVDMTRAACGFTDNSDSLGLRVDTFDHAYWFVYTSCESAWSLHPGGIFHGLENLIASTRVDFHGRIKQIKIMAEGTSLLAYENGSLLSTFNEAEREAGGMFLQFDMGTYYDNFRVTLLP